MYAIPTVSLTPYTQTVNYGGTASITVLVDSSNKSVYPTGTVTLYGGSGVVAGPITCTNAKDASGHFACQVVATFTVTSGGSISANYSGDSNYPSSYNLGIINMPDFNVSSPGGIAVTAGQSQNLTINFQSYSGLSGTVTNLSCSSGLPAETTCAFNPTSVALPADGNVSTTLTISTTAMGQSRMRGGRIVGDLRWGMTQTLVLAACFFGLPLWRRKKRAAILFSLLPLLLLVPSCGGGGSGGGPPNPVPSISSLSPSQVAAGSQVSFVLINGTNFMNSSTVTYNGVTHNSSLQNATQLAVALSPTDVATTGKYPIVVKNPSPGGGSSAPASFGVVTGTPTGSFPITVTATVGAITHTTSVSLTVQ
jgi:hypothetical protein